MAVRQFMLGWVAALVVLPTALVYGQGGGGGAGPGPGVGPGLLAACGVVSEPETCDDWYKRKYPGTSTANTTCSGNCTLSGTKCTAANGFEMWHMWWYPQAKDPNNKKRTLCVVEANNGSEIIEVGYQLCAEGRPCRCRELPSLQDPGIIVKRCEYNPLEASAKIVRTFGTLADPCFLFPSDEGCT